MKHLNGRVASYVLDICDEVLGLPGEREHSFEWLRGDPSPRRPRGTMLRVDSYWATLGLVVEVNELQHDEPSGFFDRRDTVSGVGRGQQRRVYDMRRAELIPANGLTLVVIKPGQLSVGRRASRRPERPTDVAVISAMLKHSLPSI